MADNRSLAIASIVFAVVLAIGVVAYSHGMGGPASTQGPSGQYGPMGGMGGMGPMMGGGMMGGMDNGMGARESPMGGMDEQMGTPTGYEEMEEMCHEYMYGYDMDEGAMHDDDYARNVRIVEENVTIVDAIDRGNILVVSDEDGNTYRVKMMHTYIDTDTGYLMSGVWLFEEIESMIDSNMSVDATVLVAGYRGGGVVLGITVEGLGSFMTPMAYDLSR